VFDIFPIKINLSIWKL